MGCFNFQCTACGWGEGGHGEDGRDYFDKPAAVVVTLQSGKKVTIHGRYTGYGEVETETGYTFYHPQFEEFWAGWLDYAPNNKDEKGPYIATEIYCEECLWDRDPTSLADFDFSEMEKVVDYLTKKGAAAAPTPAAPAAPAPKPKKAAKPKPLTKDQLATKVAELEAEVARLKPIEQRAVRLNQMYMEVQGKYTRLRECMDKMKAVFREDAGYW